MSSAAWCLVNLPNFWGCKHKTYTTTYKACPFYCVPKHSSHYEKHVAHLKPPGVQLFLSLTDFISVVGASHGERYNSNE
jgi:hypothetical protein